MSSTAKWIFRYRKYINFNNLSRNYSQNSYRKTLIKPSVKYLCILSGGLISYTYIKWYSPSVVDAFNPKKIKASDDSFLFFSHKKQLILQLFDNN